MRRFAVIASILVIVLAGEEASQGFLLGLGPLSSICDAVGGKPATYPRSRCFTRLCYWIGDCGHWASPIHWWNQLKPGDPTSKIIFWLGDPDRQEGEDLFWHCHKAGDAMCKAVMRDGRLVALER